MSRYQITKNFYCGKCKRYTPHKRPAGEPVGLLVYTCTKWQCGNIVRIEVQRKEVNQCKPYTG